MEEKTVYLVMCACYDEGVIASSIRVFGNEKAAVAYKQKMQLRLPDIYGVDYVMQIQRKVLETSPELKENDLY
ncbi:hypothetical protein SCRM01_245 [Synechococcus phage S-CRM01]|uniref:hypothetical protein n=1 Tax=Synechococcus phage S-CRM01 TaxID=1026955 RepID=UPI000209E446|nr:hypothetical protein SCRM01_245 [Synechococcus phage S-CRM01]AEC53191.1 hypothetical protein SCRM01_245 [Synechococcus phage S-CRM01]